MKFIDSMKSIKIPKTHRNPKINEIPKTPKNPKIDQTPRTPKSDRNPTTWTTPQIPKPAQMCVGPTRQTKTQNSMIQTIQ